jgi:taurine dioxygenase
MKITPLDAAFGAEVTGLDLEMPLDAATFDGLYEAFLNHHVLAIRDQDLSPAQQVAFTERFGIIDRPVNPRYKHPDNDRVLVLSNEIRADGTPVGLVDAGDYWHSDSSHYVNPVKLTILHSVKRPSKGGDTEFCNMHVVLDLLPGDLRKRIEGRLGIHHNSKLVNPRTTISPDRPDGKESYEISARERAYVTQPLVRTHPDTGRASVYASPRFTIGIKDMDDKEAQPLLDELFAHMTVRSAPYYMRYQWRDGDVVMWDNRSVNHRAVGGYGMEDIRRLHRTVVAGDAAFYRAA